MFRIRIENDIRQNAYTIKSRNQRTCYPWTWKNSRNEAY